MVLRQHNLSDVAQGALPVLGRRPNPFEQEERMRSIEYMDDQADGIATGVRDFNIESNDHVLRQRKIYTKHQTVHSRIVEELNNDQD